MIVRLALVLMWCAGGAVLVVAAALALGCATTVHVSTSAYDLSAEVQTGTSIMATKDAVVIERASVRETVGELDDVIGGALRAAIGLPKP